jgi:hypothetical protein
MKQLETEFMILIDSKAYSKLRHFIGLSNHDEISFLGLIDEITEGQQIKALLVSDIFLLDQTVTPIETTLANKAVADLMIELSCTGIDVSKLKCWIHSHADLKTFWSQTDEECCALLANGSYSVSIVTNARGDLLSRLDVYHPCHITLDKITTRIHYPLSSEMSELYTAEFQSKVKRSKPLPRSKDRNRVALSLDDQDELDQAFDQGYINIYEYQELAGFSVFDDVCGGA